MFRASGSLKQNRTVHIHTTNTVEDFCNSITCGSADENFVNTSGWTSTEPVQLSLHQDYRTRKMLTDVEGEDEELHVQSYVDQLPSCY